MKELRDLKDCPGNARSKMGACLNSILRNCLEFIYTPSFISIHLWLCLCKVSLHTPSFVSIDSKLCLRRVSLYTPSFVFVGVSLYA